MTHRYAMLLALLLACGGGRDEAAKGPQGPKGWIRSEGEGWEVWAPGSLVPPLEGDRSNVRVYKQGVEKVWKISWETLPCTPSFEQGRELLQQRSVAAKEKAEPETWNEGVLDVGGMPATKVRWSALGVEVLTYDIVVGARLQKLEVVGLGQLPLDAETFIATHRAHRLDPSVPECTDVPP